MRKYLINLLTPIWEMEIKVIGFSPCPLRTILMPETWAETKSLIKKLFRLK